MKPQGGFEQHFYPSIIYKRAGVVISGYLEHFPHISICI
jgi:hypothetical protein